MKFFTTCFLTLVVATGSIFAIAEPADVSGTWMLDAFAGGQDVQITLVLTQTEDKIEGTVSTPVGDGTFVDGKIDGKTLTGTVNVAVQGQDMSLAFTGEIDGEQISGTITGDSIPEVTYTGSRTKKKESDG